MKKVLFFVTVHVSIFTLSSFAMDGVRIVENTYAVAFLPKDKLAIGNSLGFGFVENTNLRLRTTTWKMRQINNSPAYDVITNQSKKKVAFLCKNFCYIYDTETEQEIDRFHIADGDDASKINYTAAFSSVDDTFFICQKEQLRFGTSSIQLPSTGHINFNIVCHPLKKQILYPNSRQSLLLKQVDGSPSIQYSLDRQMNLGDTIQCAMYNSSGTHIALLTTEKNVCRYNPATNVVLEAPFVHPCHTITFIPYTSLIAAISKTAILYFDPETLHTAVMKLLTVHHYYSDILNHTFDFSPNGAQYASILQNKLFVHDTPLEIVKNLYFFMYSCLKKYCNENNIPTDIPQLLVKRLLMSRL